MCISSSFITTFIVPQPCKFVYFLLHFSIKGLQPSPNRHRFFLLPGPLFSSPVFLCILCIIRLRIVKRVSKDIAGPFFTGLIRMGVHPKGNCLVRMPQDLGYTGKNPHRWWWRCWRSCAVVCEGADSWYHTSLQSFLSTWWGFGGVWALCCFALWIQIHCSRYVLVRAEAGKASSSHKVLHSQSRICHSWLCLHKLPCPQCSSRYGRL